MAPADNGTIQNVRNNYKISRSGSVMALAETMKSQGQTSSNKTFIDLQFLFLFIIFVEKSCPPY